MNSSTPVFFSSSSLLRCLLGLLLLLSSQWGMGQELRRNQADTAQAIDLLKQTRQLMDVDPAGGIPLADSALNISVETGYLRGHINSLTRLGELNISIGKYAAGRFYLDSAMSMVQTHNIPKGIAALSYQVGAYNRLTGDYNQALILYQRGYSIFDSLGHQRGMAVGLQNLAILYKIQGDSTFALESYRQSLALFREMGDVGGLTTNYINISILYQGNGQLDSALYYQNKALELARTEGFKKREAQALSIRAGTLLGLKRYDDAFQDLQTAETFFKNSGNRYRLAANQVFYVRLYAEQGQYEAANQALKKGHQRAKDVEAPEIEKSLYFWETRILEEQGRYQEALAAQRKMHELQLALNDKAVRQALDSLQIKVELERTERELQATEVQLAQEKLERQRKELEVEQQELKINQARLRTWLLGGLLALLLVTGGFLLMKYRDNKRHRNLLEEKQQLTQQSLEEKEMLLGEIHHRVKNNLQLVYNLLDMQRRSLSDEGGTRALQDSMDRISSMALVHEKLYGEEKPGRIAMDIYLDQLVKRVSASYNLNSERIQIVQQVAPLVLDTRVVIPLGIIVNELLTNAAKYAFPGQRKGTLTLTLQESSHGLLFEVQDDGAGCPQELLEKGKGFGLRIVRSLARQLKAKLQYYTENGVRVRLEIPLDTSQK